MVTDLSGELEGKFRKEAPLSITRGKVHDYLGMKLDFSKCGKVQILMVDYIKLMLGELPDDMGGTATMPAAQHVFETNDNPQKLDEETGELLITTWRSSCSCASARDPTYKPQWPFCCAPG